MKRATRDANPEATTLARLKEEAARRPDSFEAHVQLGDAFYDLVQHEKAIDAYRKALEIGETASLHTNLGVSLHTVRKTDEALKHFERATELDPSYWKASFNELVIYANRRNYDEAFERIRHLRELQKSNPKIPPLEELEQHLRRRAAQAPAGE